MIDRLTVEPAAHLDVDDCRRLVLGSEPWITLGYDEGDVQALVRSAATSTVLLARVDGRTVGFTISAPGVLLGEYLKLLVVEPALRSRGVGRLLMQALERHAFARWPNLYLCVSDFNRDARAFYQRLGYEEVGLLRDLLLPGRGEVLMRKSIAAWRRFAVGDPAVSSR